MQLEAAEALGNNTEEVWMLGVPVGAGESGSFHASCSNGREGFAKPAFQNSIMPRAAHEKIAADLAKLIDVCVPDVELWQNPVNSELFSISNKAFDQPLTFRQAGGLLTQILLKAAGEPFAAGLVFHTWIGDQDHANHPDNILLDAESSEESPKIAFIDHAFSMSMGVDWCDPTKPIVGIRAYYNGTEPLKKESIAHTVSLVQSISATLIRHIVMSIPVIYLPESTATVIEKALVERRNSLSAFFGV